LDKKEIEQSLQETIKIFKEYVDGSKS
jgi:hypothetical protein